jgi:CBS domain-containing protein
MSARVKDVMTTRVVAVPQDATFKDIVALLSEHRVSAFPVLDEEGKVVGVVSAGDLLSKEALVAAVGAQVARLGRVPGSPFQGDFAKAAAVTAADLMTKPPVTIGPDEPVSHAARLMYARKVKRLPVVDDRGRLVGIVSRADVLSVFSRSDAEIRRDVIENVIIGTVVTDPARFIVKVDNGIVTVEGSPENGSVGRDMIEEIRHVEGVVAVRDMLAYPAERRPAPRFELDQDF